MVVDTPEVTGDPARTPVKNPAPDTGIGVRHGMFGLEGVHWLWRSLRSLLMIDGFDFAFLVLLIFCTFAYHHNARYWQGLVTIGNWQYGDAEFWWSGAIQFAEGILR